MLQALLTLPDATCYSAIATSLGVGRSGPSSSSPTSAQDSYSPLFIGSLCLQLRNHLLADIVSSLKAAKEKNFEGLGADFFTKVASSV